MNGDENAAPPDAPPPAPPSKPSSPLVKIAGVVLCIVNVVLLLAGMFLLGTSSYLSLEVAPKVNVLARQSEKLVKVSSLDGSISMMGIAGFLAASAGAMGVFCCCCFKPICRKIYIGLTGTGVVFAILAAILYADTESSFVADKGELNRKLKDKVEMRYDVQPSFTTWFDDIQKKLKCCGATGPNDYKDSAFDQRTTPLQNAITDYYVPKSCCTEKPIQTGGLTPTQYLSCINGVNDGSTVWKTGCTEKLDDFFDYYTVKGVESFAYVWSLISVNIVFLAIAFGLSLFVKKSEDSADVEAGPPPSEAQPVDQPTAETASHGDVTAAGGKKSVGEDATKTEGSRKSVDKSDSSALVGETEKKPNKRAVLICI